MVMGNQDKPYLAMKELNGWTHGTYLRKEEEEEVATDIREHFAYHKPDALNGESK